MVAFLNGEFTARAVVKDATVADRDNDARGLSLAVWEDETAGYAFLLSSRRTTTRSPSWFIPQHLVSVMASPLFLAMF